MGGGASTAAKYKAGELSDEEALKALADLSNEDKAALRGILEEPKCEMVKANTENVNENKSKLYELEGTVLGNKTKLHAERADIEENRSLILSNNYAAMGNRQMANHNTDAIFRNQMEILKLQLKDVADPVEKNFLESRLNQMRIDSLKHRVEVNARLAKTSEMMDKVNSSLSEINEDIMQGNESIVEFNTYLLALQFDCKEASKESNAERITSNTENIAKITELAKTNIASHEKVQESTQKSRDRILTNAEVIVERRKKIEANHAKIDEGTKTIATLIAFS